MLTIRSKSMFGTSHSWAVTMRSIFNEFIKMNHKVSIISTNGDSLIPGEWQKYMLFDSKDSDLDICYTLPRNFERRFEDSSKRKIAIYNYETDIMPEAWSDNHRYIDYVLPSSSFSKKIMLKNGWPEEKCIVVPHGIDPDMFKSLDTFSLNTDKKFKFLNISIPHKRKNLHTLFDCYYEAFSSEDDVCLVVRTSLINQRLKSFEVDVVKEIFNLQKKYAGKNLPQIEIVKDPIESIVSLYNSCDCLISTSSSECFGLPLLEAMAAGLLVAAPNCSGQADFLNDKNSLIIKAKEERAPRAYQYWKPSDDAVTFFPERESVIENMISAYNKRDALLRKFKPNCKETVYKHTWKSSADKILELV